MGTFFDFGYFWFWVWLGIILVTCAIVFFVNIRSNTYNYRRYEYVKKTVRESLFWSAVFIIPAAIVGLLAVALADTVAFEKVKEPTSWSRPIENLGDGAGVTGTFFLGSGSIDAAPAYMYYLSEPEGYRLYSVYASQSYVTYTDGTPQMVVHYYKSGDTFWSRNLGRNDDQETSRTYEFQVPRGSVKSNFNLDAQ